MKTAMSPRTAITPNGSYKDLTAFDELTAHAYGTANDAPIKIFDHEGRSTFQDIGVSTLHFQKLTWFFTIISLSWLKLFLLTTALYVCILLTLATIYYIASTLCGARESSFFIALYFDAVTLSANGGYMGEDRLMTTAGTTCFKYRTALVVVGSYLNIVIGAIFAALFVSKAALSSRLQHRIIFSYHCALSPLSQDRYNLSFRIANVSKKAFVHGKLRLYMVSCVPWVQLGKKNRKFPSSAASPKLPQQSPTTSFPPSSPGFKSATVDFAGEDLDEYVTVRTTELTWRCEEEFMLNEDDNELMLWFPCTIVHRVDASSPLQNFIATQRKKGAAGASIDRNFQIVAVFEAVDAETSAVIEKKQMYTAHDIIHHYGFMHPSVVVRDPVEKQKLTVDFYRFNDMTPITASTA